MKYLLWLYPSSWRARYGDELAALMEDAPAGTLDILKGALSMRLEYESSRAIVFGFALAGILAGLGVSYLATPLRAASGVVQIEGSGDRNLAAQERIQRLMSRQVLASVVRGADLYAQKRPSTPLEDVVGRMKLQLSAFPQRPDLLRLSFEYPDSRKAVLAVNMLISKAVELEPGAANFRLIETPKMVARPAGPNRRPLMVEGLIVGVVAGAIMIRGRKSTPPPNLRTA